MDLEDLKAFLDQHPHLEIEKPGLYLFLLKPDWREKYKIRVKEAEYLAGVKIPLGTINSPHTWIDELEWYREAREKTK